MNRKNALAVTFAAALALGSVTVVATQSTAAADGSAARSGAGFRPMTADARGEAIRTADRKAAATARALELGPGERLMAKDVLLDADGTRHVRYDRTYRGLSVIGGDLVVHLAEDGRITGSDLSHQGAIRVSGTTPKLTAADASAAAVKHAQHVRKPKAGREDSTLVVYAVGKVPVLAYRSTVTGAGEAGPASRQAVIVDAGDGALLDQYELHQNVTGTGNGVNVGQVSLETTQSGSTYTLTDAAHGGTVVYDSYNSPQTNPKQNARAFSKSTNSWGNGSTSSRESAAVDAAYGLAETWDYFKDTFNRSGIRNDGRGAPAYVHVGTNLVNAFYDDDCFCMSFGDGSSQNSNTPLTALDVAGHEMSHGVTAATANLNYSGESGGLNEATSDIFGTMVEFYAGNAGNAGDAGDPGDYYVGEKVNMSNGYLRRMDNPAADGSSLSCWTSGAGSADVHYSSGIGNHFFYLASEGTGAKTIGGRSHNGTTCNNDTFAGIGKDKAAAVWYRALSAYMTSTTNYAGARTATLQAAADLYGSNSQERYLLSKAWAAVGVGTALPDPGTGTPSPSPSTTPPTGNALTNGGFEQGTGGWTQSDDIITNSSLQTAHGGSWYAWMMGYGAAAVESVSQSDIAVPSTGAPKLTLWLKVSTQESGSTAYDTLKVKVNGTTLAIWSNANASSGYVQRTVDLSAYKGRTVNLEFAGTEDAYLSTVFLVDDIAIG
ncbi:M4 family metallopeptidase [Streptomyces sp. NPDC056600]|uniref:M4 family metallopeptidase n=1 Tax=Streptomyces sp. NPDC056600 TaxID=3345874 RepID=UPI00369290CC